MTFFKPSGKYYMEVYFKIPDNTSDWEIANELKKDKKFKDLIKPEHGTGFTATGILVEYEVPFLISPANF